MAPPLHRTCQTACPRLGAGSDVRASVREREDNGDLMREHLRLCQRERAVQGDEEVGTQGSEISPLGTPASASDR